METKVNVQDVFNKVIAGGEYMQAVAMGSGMCAALRWAKYLPRGEAEAAQGAVDAYMHQVSRNYGYLASALVGKPLTSEGIRDMYEKTLAIYQDWENRPMNLPLAKYKRNRACP